MDLVPGCDFDHQVDCLRLLVVKINALRKIVKLCRLVTQKSAVRY